MNDEVKIFLAALATAPVIGLAGAFLMAATDAHTDFKDAIAVFLALTAIFVGAVLAAGAMRAVWTWAL